MRNLALARKWRPKNFKEVVGQPTVVTALTNALNTQQLHHAYLFTGTHGTGKTSVARILAKCLNCEKSISAEPCGTCSTCTEIDAGRFFDLIEVDAASRTKVEDTRDLLDNVPYAPTKGRFKIYLIDEVHMLSGHSFNALLKTLEEPPAHVKFLLATTDPQKLPATVLSRCLQFHLLNVAPKICAEHLQDILNKENIPFDVEATLLIAQAAKGSIRDALSLLDQSIAYGNGAVKTSLVRTMLGCLDPQHLQNILKSLSENNASVLLTTLTELEHIGTNHAQVLDEVLTILHDITVLQLTQKAPENSLLSADVLQHYASHFSREEIQLYYQIGLLGQRDLPLAPTARIGLEMAFMRMLAFQPDNRPQQVSDGSTRAGSVAKPITERRLGTQRASDEPTWDTLIQDLQLIGPTLALANHCALIELTADTLRLGIHSNQKTLIQPKSVERMETALKTFYNRPYRVKIEVVQTAITTPNDQLQQADVERQSKAKQALEQDESVQQLMRAFDASIVESSIKPNENSV